MATPLAAIASRAACGPTRRRRRARAAAPGAARRRGERLHERRDVLAGLDGAREGEVRLLDPVRGEGGEVGGRVAGGHEPFVVDAVVHDDDLTLRLGDGAEAIGGVVAHAHEQLRRARRGADHAPEVRDLRPLVPLGMVEEREVVDRHDARHRGPQGHRVVRTVPNVGADARGERRARACSHASRAGRRSGATPWIAAAGASEPQRGGVAAPGREVELHVAVRGEARRQGDGVVAGADRARGGPRRRRGARARRGSLTVTLFGPSARPRVS